MMKFLDKNVPESVLNILDEGNWLPDDDVLDVETPESIYMRKSLIEGLSQEAKDLLYMVLNAPDEFQAVLYNIYGQITEHTIRKYMTQRGWRFTKVKCTLEEMRKKYEDYHPRCSRKHH
jgi:hypothetical protein